MLIYRHASHHFIIAVSSIVCADLPAVDDSTLAVSGQSLVHLLAHFEPFASDAGSMQRVSLLDRLSSARFVVRSHHTTGGGEDDRSDMSVIRRMTLHLAQRNRTLERDLQVASSEAFAAREEAKSLCAEMESSHQSLLALAQEATATERARVKELTLAIDSAQHEIRRLEESVTTLTTQKAMMVPAKEHSDLRQLHDDATRQLKQLEIEVAALTRNLQHQKEQHDLQYRLALEGLESRLTQSTTKQKELLAENSELQTYLKRKSVELAHIEQQLRQSDDVNLELQTNLDQCIEKNQQLIQRIKIIEKEVQEHRNFSHQSAEN